MPSIICYEVWLEPNRFEKEIQNGYTCSRNNYKMDIEGLHLERQHKYLYDWREA